MSISPPRPKGPPLNALRAFESAARLGGFAKAAEELCVTPGAITQHIKGLEAWIGGALFDRQPQGVRLSPLGHQAAAEFTTVFDDLGRAVLGLRTSAEPSVVHIAALPSIAQLWLSPRLPALRKAFPKISLSVTALETPPNLLREAFDIGIFYSEQPASKTVIQIERDEIFPVCAPELAEKITKEAQLRDVTLISDASWARDWEVWFGAPATAPGPVYSLYSLAIEEAIHGAGALIGHRALVAGHLEAGRLIAPLPRRVRLERHLSLMVPKAPEPDGVIAKMCAMLLKS